MRNNLFTKQWITKGNWALSNSPRENSVWLRWQCQGGCDQRAFVWTLTFCLLVNVTLVISYIF